MYLFKYLIFLLDIGNVLGMNCYVGVITKTGEQPPLLFTISRETCDLCVTMTYVQSIIFVATITTEGKCGSTIASCKSSCSDLESRLAVKNCQCCDTKECNSALDPANHPRIGNGTWCHVGQRTTTSTYTTLSSQETFCKGAIDACTTISYDRYLNTSSISIYSQITQGYCTTLIGDCTSMRASMEKSPYVTNFKCCTTEQCNAALIPIPTSQPAVGTECFTGQIVSGVPDPLMPVKKEICNGDKDACATINFDKNGKVTRGMCISSMEGCDKSCADVKRLLGFSVDNCKCCDSKECNAVLNPANQPQNPGDGTKCLIGQSITTLGDTTIYTEEKFCTGVTDKCVTLNYDMNVNTGAILVRSKVIQGLCWSSIVGCDEMCKSLKSSSHVSNCKCCTTKQCNDDLRKASKNTTSGSPTAWHGATCAGSLQVITLMALTFIVAMLAK